MDSCYCKWRNILLSVYNSTLISVCLFFLQRDLGIRDLESFFEEEDEERKDSFKEEFSKFKVRCVFGLTLL